MSNKLHFVTGGQSVARWARATPEAIATIESGTFHTYQQLALDAAWAADWARAQGLRAGMILGVRCRSRYAQMVLLLAADVIGAAHMVLTDADMTFDPGVAGRCDVLCVDGGGDHGLRHPRAVRFPGFGADASGDLTAAIEMLETPRPPDALIRVGTTSGTTGQRKFVGYSRRRIAHSVWGVEHLLGHETSRYHVVALHEFNQAFTFHHAMLALTFGKTVAFCTDEDFFAMVRWFPGCHTAVLTADALELAGLCARTGQRLDTCWIRVVGSALPPATRTLLRETLSPHILSTYSANETNHVALMDDDETGTLFPDVSIRIVDEAGNEQPAGEPGVILVRSPRVTGGYMWNDAVNKARFDGDWFRTSDIGVMLDSGKLIVLGRADDMLNVGGRKVAPYPIETRIKSLKGVSDAVLLTAPGPGGLEEPHVFVEISDPAAVEALEPQIAGIMQRHVLGFALHFVARFPRTAATGKVRRNVLKDRLVPAL